MSGMGKGPSFIQRIQALTDKLSYRQYLIIMGGVSLLLGIVVFFCYSSLKSDFSSTKKDKEPQLVQVVVAKQDIPQRETIRDDMIRVVSIPAEAAPPGAFQSASEAVGQPASVPIQQGDVLTNKKVLVDPRMAGFTGMIPPNCRAITIAINDVTGVAGFAHPGDYVDVMVIHGDKSKGKVSGEILMQNVLLLGVNKKGNDTARVSNTGGKDDGKESKDGKDAKAKDSGADVNASQDTMANATLAVTPEEALKLAVAAQNGTIYLVLRPFKPNNMFVVGTEYFQFNDTDKPASASAAPAAAPAVRSSAPVSAPAPAPSYTPAPRTAAPASPSVPSYRNTIEVIRGTDSSTVGVN